MLSEAVIDKVIQGKAIAARVRAQAREQVEELAKLGLRLKLAVVRVGEDPASEIYVRGKVRACQEVGIESLHVHLPASIGESDLVTQVRLLNEDDGVDGVLVQLPLPRHIAAHRVIDAIDPRKDVDGFHPTSLGLLLGRRGLLEPCTPAGIMVMLRAAGVEVPGREAVVVGRSVIVGRPVAQLLMRADATVTVCHRHTRDLASHVGRAEILVVAAGVPGLVRGEWVREGAVVIDVGINRLEGGRIVGDVDFAGALPRVRAISPVPGGVGPMTIAMLLWNTICAGRFRREVSPPLPYLPLAPE